MKHLDLSGIDSSITLGKGRVSHLEHLRVLVLSHVKLYHVVKSNNTTFNWCPNIQTLDVSYNYLWYLKPKSFGPLSLMQFLNVSNNIFDDTCYTDVISSID